MRPDRRAFLGGLAALPLVSAPAGASEFYPVPVELIADLDRLQGSVRLGAARPDITLYEFFDYNCGFCRRTARDIRPLLQANRDLAIVLVNYAVLGIPSIGATRVALAFSRQRADRYLAFHETLFQQRGVIGAEPAIAVALRHGADKARLLRDADSDAVTGAMRTAAGLGQQLGFVATPSYLVGRDGFAGFLDRAGKQAAIDAFRRCERATCR